MLWAGAEGELELRAARDGSRRIRGRFPYGKVAVMSDGGRTGRPKKEIIAPRAFSYRVNRGTEDIHFLVGHSYDRPLASRAAGTLDLQDTEEALIFDALITEEMASVSYVRDFLAGFASGLIMGLSPGFRIPPARAVKDAETVTEEENDPEAGKHQAIIRTIHAALLYELSAVTVPAYDEAQIEARSWQPAGGGLITPRPKLGELIWR